MKVDHKTNTLDKHEMANLLGVGRSRLHELMNEPWFPQPLLITGKCRWSRDQANQASHDHKRNKFESRIKSLRVAHQSRVGNSFISYMKLRRNVDVVDGEITDKKFKDRALSALMQIHVLECERLGIDVTDINNLRKTMHRINETLKSKIR